MPIDNSQFEIQVGSLMALTPRIKQLSNMLEEPIVSEDFRQKYMSIAPAQRAAWVKQNVNSNQLLNQIDNLERVNAFMLDLANELNSILGGNKVQNVMQNQQQQSLQQAAQKPEPKATAPVDSLE
jgi:hypothetical protein